MRRFVRPSLRWGFTLSVCLSCTVDELPHFAETSGGFVSNGHQAEGTGCANGQRRGRQRPVFERKLFVCDEPGRMASRRETQRPAQAKHKPVLANG